MVVLRRLVKNGNSIQCGIPRAFLHTLGWHSGEAIALELLDDGSVWIRRANLKDLRTAGYRPKVAAAITEAPK